MRLGSICESETTWIVSLSFSSTSMGGKVRLTEPVCVASIVCESDGKDGETVAV